MLLLISFALICRIPLFVNIARGRIADPKEDRVPNRVCLIQVFREIDIEDVATTIEYPKPLTLAIVHTVKATVTDLLYLPFAVLTLIAPWRVL